jgi:hypothetical protein
MRIRYKAKERDSSQNIETSWERLPTETAKAFAAFVMYRDAGPQQRSLTLVAKHLNPGRPISVQAISEWSIKHRWKDRV